jgi:hypothetical protein
LSQHLGFKKYPAALHAMQEEASNIHSLFFYPPNLSRINILLLKLFVTNIASTDNTSTKDPSTTNSSADNPSASDPTTASDGSAGIRQ